MIRAEAITIPAEQARILRSTLEVLWDVELDALGHAVLEGPGADALQRARQRLAPLRRLLDGASVAHAGTVSLSGPPELLREGIVGTVHDTVARLSECTHPRDPSAADIRQGLSALDAAVDALTLLALHEAVSPG